MYIEKTERERERGRRFTIFSPALFPRRVRWLAPTFHRANPKRKRRKRRRRVGNIYKGSGARYTAPHAKPKSLC